MKKMLLLSVLFLAAAMATGWFLQQYSTSFGAAALLIALPFIFIFWAIECVAYTGRVHAQKLTNVSLLTGALLLAFIAAEGLLRVIKLNPTYLERIGVHHYQSPYWPDKKNSFWHVYEPNDTIHFFRGEFMYNRRINREGFAERNINLQDTAVKKILALGDSFTEGIGTTADSTWPRQLEHYLNRYAVDSFMLYNAGIGGSDPVYQYHLLTEKLWDTPWAAVIFSVNNTDIAECLIRGGMERFKPNGQVEFTKPPVWEPLYAASHLVRFVVLNVLQYSWMLLSQSDTQVCEQQALRQMAALFKKAHAALQARHIPLLVVVHPMSYEVPVGQYSFGGMDTLLHHLQGVPALSLLPYYCDTLHYTQQNYTDIYWPADGHFNANGYGLMAKKISETISPRLAALPADTNKR